jgi:hypothetical protein
MLEFSSICLEVLMRLTKLGFTRKTLRTCLQLAILAGVVIFALAPSPAAAAARCGFLTRYFSDATYSLQIGYQGLTPSSCGCREFDVGKTSRFMRTETSFCF